LPIDIVEVVAEHLKEQNQLKTLASLSVANQFLRDVTTPFLWESVRWSKRSWDAFMECVDREAGMPKMFAHIQYVRFRHHGFAREGHLIWSSTEST
jgi:hypothetical protein